MGYKIADVLALSVNARVEAETDLIIIEGTRIAAEERSQRCWCYWYVN